ncbi:putative sensor histidine kinase/response regulator [Aspergillus heteromorphus CBS 117.55]|uniref:histidine kinase n=1 Tax=Aspergillus heteromorphus CBS 117.55 TaxID=1448321 RepID=A0A317WE83_9EURO|nr:putative sensor histidine kinase/response regulator [Aspergillus heteromorphus CBS 117.55]PWY83542.1 putative sensor histidine kinase/response regulator [Aspergillus heteromorphus CBS 117.55]
MESRGSSDRGREGGPRKYAYNREGAREREMHLYLPYWGYSDTEKFAQQSVGDQPNVSRDNVLTVFAQLAAVRMHARRALISLFDRDMQHIVAEATPTLSLRSHEQSKALWLGVQRLPRRQVTLCYHAMHAFVDEGRDMFVVNDLTQDGRFKSDSSVKQHPHNKFYVSVPICSPDDYVIGSVAVLDDRPRHGVTQEQELFLKELAATVMDHLLAQRAMREEYREEKMVRALGLFVKGKSDLNDWVNSWDASNRKYGSQLVSVSKKLEQLQVAGSGDEDEGEEQAPDTVKPNPVQDTAKKRNKDVSPVHTYESQGNDESREGKSDDKGKRHRPKLSPTTSQLQDSLAPTSVRTVVNRAAVMIYQALDVEGTLFIDASVYARRQTVGSPGGPDDPDTYNVEHQTDRDGPIPSASHPGSGSDSSSVDEGKEGRSLVLGHFTSSGQDEKPGDSHYVSLSGAFVSHLIDQYPRGKIFHIEEDGSISLSYEGLAEEIHYTTSGNRGALTTEAEKMNIQQETMDIKQLMKVLPKARCIAIYPVWDFQRSRWFTVQLVWTNDPGRVLSEPKDLTYMAAFSNTVMAEVSRLDLEAADRAKGDFISSISHELRSPLHGLLGTAELLQEMVSNYAQRSLIETVYSCGRTLLDTLNHLLDYAKINTLTRSRPSDQPGKYGEPDVSRPNTAVPGTPQDEDLSVLVQEVIEGLLAGAEYQRRGSTDGSDAKQDGQLSKARLMTIVDMEWHESWQFNVYAGAWRRVVMNLFGNALKYTRTGYIRLLMKKDTLKGQDGNRMPAVRMIFSDSGRGMSQDFLTHHLYSAFLQEDTTSPGLGVGLHLVHQIVRSLSGSIHFSSEIDRGTQVDVVLPVMAPEQPLSSSPNPYEPLREKISGMTISLFTRSSQQGNLGFDPVVLDDILINLRRMMSGWFGLRVLTREELDTTKPDFTIVTEREYCDHYLRGPNEAQSETVEIRPLYPLIVLSERISSWKTLGEGVDDPIIFLTQPVSPKTLAKAFEHCIYGPEHGELFTPNKPPSPAQSPPSGSGESSSGQDMIQFQASDMAALPKNGKPSKSILLVEDNQVNLQIIEMCVKTAGFEYQTARNGLEALEKFRAGRYDAVVMADVSMPVMDGLSATRQMRHHERRKKLPPATIIILTAFISGSTQQETLRSGANMFLTKPTPLKQLKEILKKLAEGKDVVSPQS